MAVNSLLGKGKRLMKLSNQAGKINVAFNVLCGVKCVCCWCECVPPPRLFGLNELNLNLMSCAK